MVQLEVGLHFCQSTQKLNSAGTMGNTKLTVAAYALFHLHPQKCNTV